MRRPSSRPRHDAPDHNGAPTSKRAASIRRGFKYQDYVAAVSLLSTLDPGGPQAVRLENRQGGSFDDVVEEHIDSTLWMQVKWSQSPARDQVSVESLASSRGKDRTPLIAAFARSWKELRSDDRRSRIQFVTNRHMAPDFRALLRGDPPQVRPKLTKAAASRIEKAWMEKSGLSQPEFTEFVTAMEFACDRGSLRDLEAEVRRRLSQIRAPAGAFERLMRGIQEWSVDVNVDRITRSDVAQVLGIQLDVPDNRFTIDRDRLVQRHQFTATLAAVVYRSDGQYVAVLGAPGSGKSTALNTLSPCSSLSSDFDTIVYNCFTGPGDARLNTRAGADNFAKFLVQELHRVRPGQCVRQYAEGKDVEAIIAEAASRSVAGRRFLLIVDGIDYALRNTEEPGSGLLDRLPAKLPDGVTIVLSAQSAQQLPSRIGVIPPQRRLTVPALTLAETSKLLERCGVFKAWRVTESHRKNMLAEAVDKVSHGHALFSRYSADWLCRRRDADRSPSDALKKLPPYGGSIESWYAGLPALGDPYTRDLVAQMALCPFGLEPAEADSLLPHPQGPYEAEKALKAIAFLFARHGREWRFHHDSLRLHICQETGVSEPPWDRLLDFLRCLKDDPRTFEHAITVAISAGRANWASETVSFEWIADGLAIGARWDLLADGVHAALQDALRRRDWPQLTKGSLMLGLMTTWARYLLDEAPIEGAWLELGRYDAALRQSLDGDELLWHSNAALRLSDDLRECGAATEADRLAQIAIATPFDVSRLNGTRSELVSLFDYVERLAIEIDVNDCWAAVQRLAREAAQRARGPSESPNTIATGLATRAAYSCLHTGLYDRVLAWTTKPRRIAARDRSVLRGWAELRSRGDQATPGVVRPALSASADLWLLMEAARQDRFRGDVRNALKRRPLPTAWASGSALPFDEEARLQAVRELFGDSALSADLGLEDRVAQLVRAIAPPPHHDTSLVYALTVKVGVAFGRAPAKGRLQAGAEAILATLNEALRSQLSSSDRVDTYICGPAIRAILEELATSAHSDAAEHWFAEWLETMLVPAVRQSFRGWHDLVWRIRLHVALPLAEEHRGRAILDAMESLIESPDWLAHKATELAELSIAASTLSDRGRSSLLLRRAIRAAFSYGYRKDTTIEAFAEALGCAGSALGSRLLDHAALAVSCLVLLEDLTDHDHLGHAAPRLVAAVAEADPRLAARVATVLFRRLGNRFFDESIAFSLALRHLDHQVIEPVFQCNGRVLLPFWGPPSPSFPFGDRPAPLPKSLSALVRLYEREQYWERRESIGETILATVRDRRSFERVRARLEAIKERPWWLMHRLAIAAARAGLFTEARELVTRNLRSVDGEYLGWPREHRDLMKASALIAPDESLDLIAHLCDRSIDHSGRYWGAELAPIVINALMASGRTEAAIACLDEFAEHVRGLIAVYPNTEQSWRDLLIRGVSDDEGYLVVEPPAPVDA